MCRLRKSPVPVHPQSLFLDALSASGEKVVILGNERLQALFKSLAHNIRYGIANSDSLL